MERWCELQHSQHRSQSFTVSTALTCIRACTTCISREDVDLNTMQHAHARTTTCHHKPAPIPHARNPLTHDTSFLLQTTTSSRTIRTHALTHTHTHTHTHSLSLSSTSSTSLSSTSLSSTIHSPRTKQPVRCAVHLQCSWPPSS